MNWDNIVVGKVYGANDDASYLVTHKTDKWICVLHHSRNHKLVNPEIWDRSADSEWINKWNEYNDFYISEIFNNLKFIDSFTLKEKE